MINNFDWRLSDKLNESIQHILLYPADPLCNALILTGSEVAGHFVLDKLRKNFSALNPRREILFFTGQELAAFIKSSPLTLLLQNFDKLHPDLLCVLIEDLRIDILSAEKQDTLASFLKYLTKKVQVVVSTQILFYQHGSNSSPLTRELWSWFVSGKDFCLPPECIIYTQDLSGALTLTQDKQKGKLLPKISRPHSFGELYAGILSNEPERTYTESMEMELGILWLGTFHPRIGCFPKARCPVCQEQSLIPYSCIASMLSGGHIIRFYCTHCKERVATNNVPDYFRLLMDFARTHPACRAQQDNCIYSTKKGSVKNGTFFRK